jgi:hypothetical protein
MALECVRCGLELSAVRDFGGNYLARAGAGSWAICDIADGGVIRHSVSRLTPQVAQELRDIERLWG